MSHILFKLSTSFARLAAGLFITAITLGTAMGDDGIHATLTRAAFFAAHPEATINFYKDVLLYEEGETARNVGPYPADNAWGIPEGSHLRLTYLKSHDGAYIAVMGLEDSTLASLARPDGTTNTFGDVMLIHLVKNIDEIHNRAVSGGYSVLKPPTLSTSGYSKQMFLRDPNGIRIELNEIIGE